MFFDLTIGNTHRPNGVTAKRRTERERERWEDIQGIQKMKNMSRNELERTAAFAKRATRIDSFFSLTFRWQIFVASFPSPITSCGLSFSVNCNQKPRAKMKKRWSHKVSNSSLVPFKSQLEKWEKMIFSNLTSFFTFEISSFRPVPKTVNSPTSLLYFFGGIKDARESRSHGNSLPSRQALLLQRWRPRNCEH